MHFPWFSPDERDFARFRSHGDAAALARVFDRNAPALLALARHLAPRGEEPEDLVQATFLTAIEKRGVWDPGRRVGPWLAGILGYHARAARRRALRAAEGPADDVSAHTELTDSAALEPSEVVVHRERAEAFDALLTSLPPRDRDVLVPYLVEGATAAEIGERLGIAANAVYQQVHRALHRLAPRVPPSWLPSIALLDPQSTRRALSRLCKSMLTAAQPSHVRHTLLPHTAFRLRWLGFAVVGCAPLLAVAAQRIRASEDVRGLSAAAAPRDEPLVTPGLQAGPLRTAAVPVVTDERAARPLPLQLECLVQSTRDSALLRDASLWLRGDSLRAESVCIAESDTSAIPLCRASVTEEELLELEVRAPGHVTWRVPRDPKLRAWVFESTLSEGDGTRLCSVFLRPARRVVGRVIDSGGNPVAFAELSVVGNVDGAPYPDDDRPDGWTDAGGRFVLDDAVSAASSSSQGIIATLDRGRGQVQVGWRALGADDGRDGGPEFVVQLGREHSIDVTVVDTEDRPVADVEVLALPAGGPWQRAYGVGVLESLPVRWTRAYEAALRARTDANGRARFPQLPLLPPPDMGLYDGARIHGEGVEWGQYSFAITGTGFKTHKQAVALVALPQREGALLAPPLAGVAHQALGGFPVPRHVVELR